MPRPPDVRFLTPTVPVYTLAAPAPGPTVVVQGGIHGDEVAGVHALQELLEEGFLPDRGRLLVIPVMNPAAYRARQRAAPGGLDLNRSFPGDPASPDRERRLAAAFMALYREERPAMVATLHESWKRFHPEVPASFAQTLIYGEEPMPDLVPRVVARLNEHLEHPYERWAPHFYPIPTASTEVIVAELGCLGLCVETWLGFEEPRRVAMQRLVIRFLLEDLGLLDAA